MNSFTCAFFDQRVKSADTITFPLIRSSVLSCQFVTRDAFNRGKWTRVRSEAVQVSESDLPYRETEQSGWIGAKVIGTGLMTGFLNAYFGLRSWNEMKNPKYYESLLFGRRPPPIAVS
jgi:hypothetical protein